MIRFAEDSDIPWLKALWQNAFGDPPDAVDFFFANRHQNRNMLVYTDSGAAVGMLTMLPVEIDFGNEARRGRYIYAVATDPVYRGKGISTDLLETCHEFMRENGETASVLVPATESLFDFYKNRGFRTVFYTDNIVITPEELPPVPAEAVYMPCGPDDFVRLRSASFSGRGIFVRWDRDALAYVLKSSRAFGDDVHYFRTCEGEGYAVWERHGPKVCVRELALAGIGVKDAMAVLHTAVGADKYELRLPEGAADGAGSRPFGMIRFIGEEPAILGKPPYLSLVLD